MLKNINIFTLFLIIVCFHNAFARHLYSDHLRHYEKLGSFSSSVINHNLSLNHVNENRNIFPKNYCFSISEHQVYKWKNTFRSGYASHTELSSNEKVIHKNNSGKAWDQENVSWQFKTSSFFPNWQYCILNVIIMAFLVFVICRFRSKKNILKNQLTREHLELAKQKEINQVKSDFFTNISHEFRTPLSLIMGPIPHWLNTLKDEDLKNDLMMILKNSRRMLGFINQIVELSLLDYGRMKLTLRPMNIVEILKDLVLSFTSLAQQKEINLSFSSSHDSIIVFIDRDKFEEIISNLIYNSFKFTPSNGKIAVSVFIRRTDDEYVELIQYAEITVMDTGKGIENDHINKIFDRFYQIENVHGAYKDGCGIGLCYAKELTKLHHGKIYVKSKVNRGTIFTVLLPLGKDQISKEDIIEEYSPDEFITHCEKLRSMEVMPDIECNEIAEEELTTPETKKGPHLLIIEDNADVRAYLKRTLEVDYHISEASNGTEGIKTAIKTEPDLIISDVMMPGMDGYDLCRMIKTNHKTSHIPVILLTAKSTPENKIEGLETGADDYIVKPFDMTELLVRIKNLLTQRKMLQQRFQSEMIVQPADITATSVDNLFLQRAISSVEKHICEPDFEIQILAYEVGMSRMNLHRKLKVLTGLTPAHFISTIRLKRAAQLLKQNAGNVSEVAYKVGFNSLSYFANCFRSEFGMLPSVFLKNQKLHQEIDFKE